MSRPGTSIAAPVRCSDRRSRARARRSPAWQRVRERIDCASEGNPRSEAHAQPLGTDHQSVRCRARYVRRIPGPGKLFIDRERGPPCLRRVVERWAEIEGIGLRVRGVEAEMTGIGILVQKLDTPEPAGRNAIGGAEIEFQSGFMVPDSSRDVVDPD